MHLERCVKDLVVLLRYQEQQVPLVMRLRSDKVESGAINYLHALKSSSGYLQRVMELFLEGIRRGHILSRFTGHRSRVYCSEVNAFMLHSALTCFIP